MLIGHGLLDDDVHGRRRCSPRRWRHVCRSRWRWPRAVCQDGRRAWNDSPCSGRWTCRPPSHAWQEASPSARARYRQTATNSSPLFLAARTWLVAMRPQPTRAYFMFYSTSMLSRHANALHGVFRVKDGLCVSLHQVIVHVGVCGGHHDQIGRSHRLRREIGDAGIGLPVVPARRDPGIEIAHLGPTRLKPFDHAKRRAFAVVVDVLLVRHAPRPRRSPRSWPSGFRSGRGQPGRRSTPACGR